MFILSFIKKRKSETGPALNYVQTLLACISFSMNEFQWKYRGLNCANFLGRTTVAFQLTLGEG